MKMRKAKAVLMAVLVLALLLSPTAVPAVGLDEPAAGSISGFLWVDGNGMLSTDWDGLYNGSEAPLAGYAVALYASDNLHASITDTLTDADGVYMFEGLAPGSYAVGLASAVVNGNEYLLPMSVTGESVFAIDWDSEPLTAWSEAIEITEAGEAVTGVNAGMRLPMGIVPLSGEFVVTGAAPAAGMYNTLEDAVSAVNSGTAGSYTITVGKNEILSWEKTINPGRNITLVSGGGGPYVITQPQLCRHFWVDGSLTLRNIILDGNNKTAGGVEVYGALTMEAGAVIQNCRGLTRSSLTQGGGVCVAAGGTFTMNDGLITNNIVEGSWPSGGGVHTAGTFTMYGGKISGNAACTVNTPYASGGGVTSTGTFNMHGGEISGNTSGDMGGGILAQGTFNMYSGKISGNHALGAGGAGVFISYGTFTMTDGEITSHTTISGAGVYIGDNGIFNMNGGKIHDNTATGSGGGVHNGYYGAFNMSGGKIFDNTADWGGGVSSTGNGSLSNGGEIFGNTATNNGGGMYVGDRTFTVSGGKIAGNTANLGGGIYTNFADLVMEGGTISGNKASTHGGGVYVRWMNGSSYGTFSMTGGSITGNDATGGNGGGIYTDRYHYADPVDAGWAYAYLSISGSASVSGNTASVLSPPPNNVTGTPNFDKNLLTNGNINYLNPSPNIVIVYTANGGIGADYVQDTGTLVTPVTDLTIKTLAATGISAPPSMTFVGWNTLPDGTGTSYTEGETPVTIHGSMMLYAQWESCYRYIVTKDSDGTRVGSYHWLQDAVDACGTGGAYTITLTGEDDFDLSDYDGNAGSGSIPAFISTPANDYVTIPPAKTITLTSDTDSWGWYRTITQKSYYNRHFVVEGQLTLKNVELTGQGKWGTPAGGIDVDAGALLTIETGAVLFQCNGYVSLTTPGAYTGDYYGGGVYIAPDALFTMTGGKIYYNDANYGGGVYNEGGTFDMQNGSITDNYASGGGGVCNMGNWVWDGVNNYWPCIPATFTMSGGKISDNYASWSGGGVYSDSSDFTMSGSAKIADNTVSGYGGGVYCYGYPDELNGSILYGRFIMNGGTISGNTSSSNSGGGVYNSYGWFEMNSGALISGNTASYEGGGVYNEGTFDIWNTGMPHGTFLMNDGTIYGNTSYNGGGGVYNYGGAFTLGNGAISNNTVQNNSSYWSGGGGVYNEGKYINDWMRGTDFYMGSLTMTGGTISNNKVYNSHGGGVFNDNCSDFDMKGGSITGNIVQNDGYGGGGVYNPSSGGSFDISGGSIDNNRATWGGGIYNNVDLNMSGGSITQNRATKSEGGGIYLDGTLNMTGGSITGNQAPGSDGGGIYVWNCDYNDPVDASWAYTNISITAPATVSGNTAGVKYKPPNNVSPSLSALGFDKALLDNYEINYQGDPVTGRYLVYKGDPLPPNFINEYYWLQDAVDACGNMIPDGPYTIVATQNDPDVTDCLNNSKSGTGNQTLPVFLQNPSPCTSGLDAYVTFPSAKAIMLTSDAGGPYTITKQASPQYNSNTRHLIVEGKLTLKDIELAGQGSSYGCPNSGGVDVDAGAFLTMENGAVIRDCIGFVSMSNSNYMAPYGGGVYVFTTGTFTMNGGEIRDNLAYSYGGGVYLCPDATFNMNGGHIKDNEARAHGGGVYMDSNSVFVMTGINGSEISDNTANANGGGVYMEDSSVFTMQNGDIKDNHAGSHGGGVYNKGGAFAMHDGTISGHIINSYGGGVYNEGCSMWDSVTGNTYYIGSFTMSGGTISGNKAVYGGGVYNYQATFAMGNNAVIFDNTALQYGGGVLNTGYYDSGSSTWYGIFTMSGKAAVTGNTAGYINNYGGAGGGIHNGALFEMYNGTISSNTLLTFNYGGGGGGVYSGYSSIFNMYAGMISDNTAVDFRNGGGGMSLSGCDFNMSGGSITGNRTPDGNGGGIHNSGGSFNMTGGSITGNHAPVGDGGGIYNDPYNYDDPVDLLWGAYMNLGISGPVTISGNTARVQHRPPSGVINGGPLKFDLKYLTNFNINYLGGPEVETTTLTVSKEVTGKDADPLIDFTFTLTIRDASSTPVAGETFSYTKTGAGISPPETGTLALTDSGGKTTFTLKHGQTISIEGVASGGFIQIVETTEPNYSAFFVDSDAPLVSVDSNDTTMLAMSKNRSFAFTNEHDPIPPGGIAAGGPETMLPLFALAFLAAPIIHKAAYRRRRKA